MFKTSRYRRKLRVLRVNGFSFDFEIVVIRAHALGNLTGPVRLFAKVVRNYFGREITKQRVTSSRRNANAA
jgi:hypothetical protein